MCEECTHLKHIYVSKCVSFCKFLFAMIDNVRHHDVSPGGKEVATGLEVQSLLLFGLHKQLTPLFSFPVISWTPLSSQYVTYFFEEPVGAVHLCKVQILDRHVSASFG